ncbi:transmembrane protein 134 isoform X19 [Balaenoptera musculus]|uniref:Transmembrane protein 134 isoform X19 n=1 Tax=Balaenoptera musculus TaxID=9771 RepID=A0A8B8Y4G9_BALMU|nr:transmembrane protein 134 isoform X19 [Balaenoptera musculus]
MTLSSCPWRTRALGPSTAGSPASGRCTSSAGPGSRWPTRTSSPGCATSHYWRAQSPDLAARPSPPAGDPNLESPLILEGREEGPEPSHPSEACVLEQNLENDEDGAQASPEPEGGASTRSGPGILAEHPSAAPSGPLATSAPALSAPTTPAAACQLGNKQTWLHPRNGRAASRRSLSP